MTDYEFLKQKHGFEQETEIEWDFHYQSKLIPDSSRANLKGRD